MAPRMRGPLAAFGWLKNGINLGHRNPKAVFGGAAIVGLLSLVPSLVTTPLQIWQPGGTTLVVTMVLSLLVGLALMPLFAGFMRIIDATQRGEATRASHVLHPYRNGDWKRLVGFGLAMLVLYALAMALMLGALGGEWMRLYAAAMSGDTEAVASMPVGVPGNLGALVALGAVLALLVGGIYAISLGQVALGGVPVAGALRDGLVGALKNVLPLLVLAVVGLLLGFVLMLLFGLVVALLAVLGNLVGTWFTVVLMVPMYIALLLAMYVVMFGVMYHLWRDICGEPVTPAPPADALTA